MKNRNISVESDERENRIVQRDFVQVIVLNIVLFALMVGLYYWNRSTGELERIFDRLIQF